MQAFLYIYLGIGFIYAMYIWLFAGDKWYAIPINIVGGPLVILYQMYYSYKRFSKKKVELADIFKGKKAVIVDMDGTIINSREQWDTALLNVQKNIGMQITYSGYSQGLNIREKWEEIIEFTKLETNLSIEDLVVKTKKEFIDQLDSIEIMAGFWDFAYKAGVEMGLKFGLASNTDRDVINAVVEHFELDEVFETIIGGDEVKNRKPDPEMYKTSIANLKLTPKDVVIFEDSVAGTEAAVASGADTIVIYDGENQRRDYPKDVKLFIGDFENTAPFLDKTLEQYLKEQAEELQKNQPQTNE